MGTWLHAHDKERSMYKMNSVLWRKEIVANNLSGSGCVWWKELLITDKEIIMFSGQTPIDGLRPQTRT